MTEAPRSRATFLFSDVHFDVHDRALWAAAVACVREVRPHRVIFPGDMLDFGMLSAYVQGAQDPTQAIPQIQCFVEAVNSLVEYAGGVVIIEGNHDERWAKIFTGKALALLGAKGLTLEDQCRAWGLDRRVSWRVESKDLDSTVRVGSVRIRHGHKQAGRFGGGVNPAMTTLRKYRRGSVVVGHHHRAQIDYHTSDGVTDWCMAMPCMTVDHDYAPDPNWQRGFAVIHVWGPEGAEHTAPQIVLAHNGAFVYDGRVYDGRAILAAQAAAAKAARPPKRRAA
jgi:metallophosphoesterase superfamily enzyme